MFLKERRCVLRVEAVLFLKKLLAVALLVAALLAMRTARPVPLRRVTDGGSGIHIYYPATWEFAKGSRAMEQAGVWPVEAAGDDSWRRPRGIAVSVLVFPLRLFTAATDTEGQQLLEASCAEPVGLTAWVAQQFTFVCEDLTISHCTLLGSPATKLTGARTFGGWGSVVFCVDGEELFVFEIVAPDRVAYQRFEPTWR